MDGALVVAPMLSAEVDIGVMTPNAWLFNRFIGGDPLAFLQRPGPARPRGGAVVMRTHHYDAGVKALPDLARMKGKLAAVGAASSINQYGLGSVLSLPVLIRCATCNGRRRSAAPDIVQAARPKQIDLPS